MNLYYSIQNTQVCLSKYNDTSIMIHLLKWGNGNSKALWKKLI